MTEDRIAFDEVIECMYSTFPDVLRRAEEACSVGLSAGLPHAALGSEFCPWLLAVIESDPAGQREETAKGFGFIEELLRRGDARVQELVHVTILEFLLASAGRDVAERLSGPLANAELATMT